MAKKTNRSGKAKNNSISKKTNGKKKTSNKVVSKNNEENITFVKKTLVILGVAILFFAVLYLMNFYFVKNSNINVNMSMDKQFDFIDVNGEEKQITTQKYVSDLGYSMRYDIKEFKILKYKSKDIFKYNNDEKTAVILEVVDSLVGGCVPSSANTIYSNCYIKVDSFTEEYYISSNDKVYKMTIKRPGNNEYNELSEAEINYMMKSLVIG